MVVSIIMFPHPVHPPFLLSEFLLAPSHLELAHSSDLLQMETALYSDTYSFVVGVCCCWLFGSCTHRLFSYIDWTWVGVCPLRLHFQICTIHTNTIQYITLPIGRIRTIVMYECHKRISQTRCIRRRKLSEIVILFPLFSPHVIFTNIRFSPMNENFDFWINYLYTGSSHLQSSIFVPKHYGKKWHF